MCVCVCVSVSVCEREREKDLACFGCSAVWENGFFILKLLCVSNDALKLLSLEQVCVCVCVKPLGQTLLIKSACLMCLWSRFS